MVAGLQMNSVHPMLTRESKRERYEGLCGVAGPCGGGFGTAFGNSPWE